MNKWQFSRPTVCSEIGILKKNRDTEPISSIPIFRDTEKKLCESLQPSDLMLTQKQLHRAKVVNVSSYCTVGQDVVQMPEVHMRKDTNYDGSAVTCKTGRT